MGGWTVRVDTPLDVPADLHPRPARRGRRRGDGAAQRHRAGGRGRHAPRRRHQLPRRRRRRGPLPAVHRPQLDRAGRAVAGAGRARAADAAAQRRQRAAGARARPRLPARRHRPQALGARPRRAAGAAAHRHPARASASASGCRSLLVRSWLVPGLPLPLPCASWIAGRAGAGRRLRRRVRGRRPGGARVARLPALRRTPPGRRAPLVGHRPAHPRRPRGGDPGQQALGRAVRASPTPPTWSCRCCSPSSPASPRPGSPPCWRRGGPARSRGRSLSGFVSSRAISRRQEGTLVILPITAAIAVAVFGAGVYDSAATWRTSVAATASPADTTWSTHALALRGDRPHPPHRPRRRVDHGGRQRRQPRRQLLRRRQQPPRAGRDLAADLEPGHATSTRSSTRSRPAAWSRPCRASGSRITIDNQADMDRDLAVEVRFGSRAGVPLKAYLGPFPHGREHPDRPRSRSAREGCPLEGMTLGGGAGTNTRDVGHAARRSTSTSTARRSRAAIDGAGWTPTPDPAVRTSITDMQRGRRRRST